MTTLHVFFTLGIVNSSLRYVEGPDGLANLRRRFRGGGQAEVSVRSALPACLALLGTPSEGTILRLHLFPTEDVLVPPKDRPDAPAPSEACRDDLPQWARFLLAKGEELREHLLADVRSPANIWKIVDRVLDRELIKDGDEVWLETTGGLRSVTVGFQLAALLLISLRPKVRVLGMTYAEVIPYEKTGVIYDLLPFLSMASEAPAAAALRYRLDPRPLITHLETAPPEGPLHELVGLLRPVSDAIDMGWPAELRDGLVSLRDGLGGVRGRVSDTDRHLVAYLEEMLQPLIRPLPPSAIVGVDEATLDHELFLCASLIHADRHADAVRLFRETMVSFMVLATYRRAGSQGPCPNVRERRSRGEAERAWFRLGAWAGVNWLEAGRLRNSASHAGANDSGVTAEEVREFMTTERVAALRAALGTVDWWEGLARARTAGLPQWWVAGSLLDSAPVADAHLIDVGKVRARVGRGWGEETWRKKSENVVPSEVYLSIDPVRAAQIADQCHKAGVPVYYWDGSAKSQFPSPFE